MLTSYKSQVYLNKPMADMLLSTGKKILAEASFDNVWGTGVPLHYKDALDHEGWVGIGLLGEMLTIVRDQLRIATVHEPMDSTGDQTAEASSSNS